MQQWTAIIEDRMATSSKSMNTVKRISSVEWVWYGRKAHSWEYAWAAVPPVMHLWPCREPWRKVTLPDGGIEKYHYDACGRLRELITGEQKTSYGYDKAGRLAEVCASNGIRAQYQYDKNDMQTEVLYGNGLRTLYTYDERSQLTGMESVLKDGRKLSYSGRGINQEAALCVWCL